MQVISSQLSCQDEKNLIISINSLGKVISPPSFLLSATSLKLHCEPQSGICIFMDRTGSQVEQHVYNSLSYFDPCYELGETYNYLIFPISHIANNLCSYLQLVNCLSQENLMAHLSTFLPALLDAFENHSPYVRKVVNPLPLFSTDSVFNKALSFWAHVLIVLHLLEFTRTKRL